MPAPIRDAIVTPEETKYRFDIEPVVNVLYSLMLLTRTDELSGLSPAILAIVERMDEETRKRNLLVLWGLHYAITPDQSWGSFPAYLEHMGSLPPDVLRKRILDTYLSMSSKTHASQPTHEAILESEEQFLAFLRDRFDEEFIYEDVERQAYRLLKKPVKMQRLIVDHLQQMWETYFQEEWRSVLPLIQESVASFDEITMDAMTEEEALAFVTGQTNEKWAEKHAHESHRFIFVPSAHVGPYTGMFKGEHVVWVIFGARQPSGVRQGISDLSRAELLVWLAALSDETRLKMLGLIKERGEICAQEIIDLLDLSQSSTSRHLRQLTASGFLRERRTEAGKCYSLNEDRFVETAQTIRHYAE